MFRERISHQESGKAIFKFPSLLLWMEKEVRLTHEPQEGGRVPLNLFLGAMNKPMPVIVDQLTGRLPVKELLPRSSWDKATIELHETGREPEKSFSDRIIA